MNRLLQHMLSNKLNTSKPPRVQMPSISPTSEETLTGTGSDYKTYYTYKYYGHTTPNAAR